MQPEWDTNRDYHSFANPDEVRVAHLALTLAVDFDARRLAGTAELSLTYMLPDVRHLFLDSKDLQILKVQTPDGEALPYCLDARDPVLGQRLNIALESHPAKMVIHYLTSPQAQGLQWLAPEQTRGKRLPYLFSQSQPIDARSWIPLQDTPQARITFEAKLTVPKGMRAVMSAMNSADTPLEGQFAFSMEKPIPTHLLALAVGELAYAELGPRSGIYTEPAMLAAAAAEFEDTEQMMAIAESLLGPYAWGRYDILVLPPSFPFGGMENPRLAFITPTLIAGDKSLVSTVAHELAHSWTGNLVSNASWRDLWLNEGFTTYFTNRIVEAVYGKEQAELEWVLEFTRLQEEMQLLPLARQTLPANVQDEDPQQAFNRFTYDKASLFVHQLEACLGRPAFDAFLHDYVAHFAFQAITTETFVDYARQTLLHEHGDKFTEAQLLEWVYGAGLPSEFVAPSSSSLDKVTEALHAWLGGTQAMRLEVQDWRVQHWQYFLAQLPEILSHGQLAELDACFKLTQSTNAEIACDWFRAAIRNNYDPVLPALGDYLCAIGRGKFVRPLYTELKIAGYLEQMRAIYARARSGYHPSIQLQLDALLEE
ncbi:M1 family metallopeptidase [Shewanella sp. AS16]|uniref:M1 family metallopeptidase n=1 Tax=Shewanella sp. AS16 TaxID=2907625 RepID=UPI001F43623E|nr:M1 family metallopeptidase [Shewanella sp. AS16]MCE9685168.1 M1 family metallopeptidase [Shewanella sp. AS16]